VQKLFALEGVEIFAQSDVDDLAALAALAREQRFRRGERIYSEGDPGDAVYVILEGQVEMKRQGERVMLLREKEAFGELSLFDGAPRVTDNQALVDTRTLVIDRRDFLELLAERPELIRGVFAVLSRQLKSMVVELSERRSTGELPVVSLELPQEEGAPRDDGPPVP
jgi:CRP-like cAMP-binding protein